MILMASSVLLSLAIVGFGWYQGMRSFGAYRTTLGEVIRLTAELAAGSDGESLVAACRNGYRAGGRMTRTIAGYLVNHFEREPIRLHGRLGWVVDIDDLCDGKRLFRAHPAFGRTEAMPGLLMGVGILFTFLGLAIGVFGLDPTNADQLTLGVRKLLGGMSLAFLTSIAGIGSALWWTWRQKAIAGAFEACFADLAEQLRSKPFLLEPEFLNYQMLDDQAIQTKCLTALEDTVHRAFARALEQAGLRGEVGATPAPAEQGRSQRLLERIGEELVALNGGLALLTATQEKMQDWLGPKPAGPERTVAIAGTDAQSRLLAETQTVLTQFTGAQEHQLQTVESIREAATEMRALVQSTRRTSADLVQNHRIMMGHIQRLEEHWDNYREQLNRMQTTLDTTLTGFQNDLGTALRGVHGEIDTLLAKSLEHFSDALARFQETIDALSLLARTETDRDNDKRSLFGKKQ